MLKPKTVAAMAAVLITLVSITLGYNQRKAAYDEFVLFKQGESATSAERVIKNIEMLPISSARETPVLEIEDFSGDKYRIKLPDVSNEHLEMLAKFNFSNSKLKYFNFQKQRCLVEISKDEKTVIKGDTKSSALKPFNYFVSYNYYCDSI